LKFKHSARRIGGEISKQLEMEIVSRAKRLRVSRNGERSGAHEPGKNGLGKAIFAGGGDITT